MTDPRPCRGDAYQWADTGLPFGHACSDCAHSVERGGKCGPVLNVDAMFLANGIASGSGFPVPWPGLRVGDLSPSAQEWLGATIRKALKQRDERRSNADDNIVYLWVLEYFGLECPHPRRTRHDYYPVGSWDCEVCGCAFTPAPAGVAANRAERRRAGVK